MNEKEDNRSIARRFFSDIAKGAKEREGFGFETKHIIVSLLISLGIYVVGILIYGFIKFAFSPIKKEGDTGILKTTSYMISNNFSLWIIFVIIAVALGFLIVYRFIINHTEYDRHGNEIDKSNIHGSSRELTDDILGQTLALTTNSHPDGIIIGRINKKPFAIVSAPWWSNLLHPLPNRNIWLCGASGSGKTKYHIIHHIFQDFLEGRNLITTDPKGELFRETIAQAIYAGKEIYILNTSSFEHSDGWDVIKIIRDSSEPEQATELFVTTILEAQGKAQAAFFGPSIENVLYVATLYVAKAKSFTPFEIANSNSENIPPGYDPSDYGTGLQYYKHRTYDEVYKLVSSLGQKKGDNAVKIDVKSMEEIVGMAIVKSPEDAELLRAPYSVWVGHKEKDNNQSSLAVELRKFSGNTVRRVLSTNDIDIMKVLSGKAVLYVVCDDGISPYKDILALFFSFLFKTIAAMSDKTKSGSLDIPLDIIWEELNNIGRITELGDFLSVCRSRNVGTLLCNQNIGQVIDKYKGSGGDKPHEYLNILANCSIQICAGSNDELTDEYFANKCGYYSVFESSTSHDLSKLGFRDPTERESIKGVKGQVFTPDDMEDLKITEEIVCIATQKGGAKLDKYFYKDHPYYRIKLQDRETGELVKPHPSIHVPKWKGGKSVKETILEKYEVITLTEEEVGDLIDREYMEFKNSREDVPTYTVGFEEFL